MSSPADIPADKKDDFFKAVDKGYKAKNEDCAAADAVDEDDDEDQVDENGRPAWKYQTRKPGEPPKDDEEEGPPVWDYQKRHPKGK